MIRNNERESRPTSDPRRFAATALCALLIGAALAPAEAGRRERGERTASRARSGATAQAGEAGSTSLAERLAARAGTEERLRRLRARRTERRDPALLEALATSRVISERRAPQPRLSPAVRELLSAAAKAGAEESTMLDLVAVPGRSASLAGAIEAGGGKVLALHGPRVRARVPLSGLESVLDAGAVRAARVARTPTRRAERLLDRTTAKTGAVESEGVELSGADAWIAADTAVYGLERSTNVRIGILDFGFEGYASLVGDELTSGVTVQDFAPDWDIEGCFSGQSPPCGVGIPGTQMAEIVSDMAPSADLVLIAVDPNDLASMRQAVDFLASGGPGGAPSVDLVVSGLTWNPGDFGDGFGTGPINELVTEAAAAGVAWINDVGDRDALALALYGFFPAAADHWTGSFEDTVDHFFSGTFDNDGYMDRWFADQDAQAGETWLNEFCLGPLDFMFLDLVWDDWVDPDGNGSPAASEDYSIDVYEDIGGGEIALFDSSSGFFGNEQSGIEGQYPWDSLDVFNSSETETVCFFLTVFAEAADGANRFHLYWAADSDAVPGSVGAGFVAPDSLTAGNRLIPADSPEVYSVASTSIGDELEPFTTFGLPEETTVPYVCAPDDVSTSTDPDSFFSFFSAAHVAGAVGLLMEKVSFLDPPTAIRVIEGRAKSLSGVDPERCGSGRLCLTTDRCP